MNSIKLVSFNRRSIFHMFLLVGLLVGSLAFSGASTVLAAPVWQTRTIDGGSVGEYSSLALDSNGNPVISYYDSANTSLKLMHCGNLTCTNGNSIVTVDNSADVGQWSSLALDSSGFPVISYYDATNGDLKLAHCVDPNCTVGTAVVIQTVDTTTNDAYTVGQYSSLALDSSGRPAISYFRETTNGGTLKFVRCGDASCTSGNTIRDLDQSNSGNNFGLYTSIALNSANIPYIAYWDAENTDIKLVYCGNATCGSNNDYRTPHNGAGAWLSVAVDSSDYAVVSMYQSNLGNNQWDDLALLRCTSAGCGSDNRTLTTVESDGSVGQYSSLALDSNGNPVISYYKDGYLRLVNCGNATCSSGNSFVNLDNSVDTTSLALDSDDYPVISYGHSSGLKLARFVADTTSPSVTVNQASGQADPTNGSTINFTAVFNEAMLDFTSSDVILGGTAGATTAVVTGGPSTYNIAVSGMSSSGTVTASIAANKATDATGNFNTASTSSDNSVLFDNTAPTVTINQASGQADPTGASPINYTAVFNEAVNGFTSADVTVGGTAGATTAVVTGGPSTYNIAVSGMTTGGTVSASIGASKATDVAGNGNAASTSSDNTVTFVADTTPPVITPNVGGASGANGWYVSNVSVSWSVVDDESSITSQTGCSATSVDTDTNGVTFSCSATSAGGSDTKSVTIKRDATAPTITYADRTAANAAGWNNSAVTVNWTCSDVTSGVVNANVSQTVSSEGTNQSATGSCSDNAGNSASNTQSGINIDTTAPTITAAATTDPNTAGWYNTDVTVQFTCTDGTGSGIPDGTCPAAQVLSTEGAAVASTAQTVTDAAGNTSAASNVVTVKIDKTAPVLTITTPQLYDVQPLGTALDFSASDALSGLDGAAMATLTSADGSTAVISGFVPGVGVYSIVVSATDLAGNTTTSAEHLLVIYDPSGGFVTGGGWIDSPAGAYTADPGLTGKATFGFVAKYKRGQITPDGNTQFQFQAGDLNFKSTSYEWLVVAGNKAQFKGAGTINGEGSYKFMISADDDNPDTFRIKIWYEENGVEVVVYDNGSQQPLGGGSIKVHR